MRYIGWVIGTFLGTAINIWWGLISVQTCLIIGAAELVYFISLEYCRWWFKTAFGKEGCWSNLKPGNTEVLLTTLPLLNTMFVVVSLFHSPYQLKRDRSKFFDL